MDQELLTLMKVSIDDGVITEKERNVLKQKAVDLGMDIGEFEIILEAALKDRQRELKEAQMQQKKESRGKILKFLSQKWVVFTILAILLIILCLIFESFLYFTLFVIVPVGLIVLIVTRRKKKNKE